jgi:glycosyltransferase involved in cell wall biosynthesis
MIGEGMAARGHGVDYWTSPHIFGRISLRRGLRKWLGYIDQFLIFPVLLRARVRRLPAETLFVVADQALGMWVPDIRHRPHVIHCHDFLAQRSARGEFPENPTGWSGRVYQALIRRGYRQGRAFISVSQKTQADLHAFLPRIPEISEVAYNPLNHAFAPLSREEAYGRLAPWAAELRGGFLLHVGGNQWYKNRLGVLAIYRAYCEREQQPLPLFMVGPFHAELMRQADKCPNGGRVVFGSNLTDEQVHAAYAVATAFLFPSLEEGFGWPIAEAQACDCPVLTTGAAPMTEVGGDAATYLPRRPANGDFTPWAAQCADILIKLLANERERTAQIERGRRNTRRFSTEEGIRGYEEIYQRIIGEFLRNE